MRFISQNALILTFLISSIAVVGSLFFQYALHFTPCEMCWYQRIFMYPLAVISGVALFRNEKKADIYIVPLAVIGLLLALYHILIQMFPKVVPCTSETVSCAEKQLALLGFVTIPVMSAAAFILILFLMYFSRRK